MLEGKPKNLYLNHVLIHDLMNKLYVSLGLMLLITSIALHTALVKSNGQVNVLLVVDDDGTRPSETVEKENGEILNVPEEMSVDVTPYHDAFSQPAMSGYTLTEWHTSTSGSPTLTDLQNYAVVIWATGNEYVAINSAEAQTLADYYNNGYGDLILEGGEIFWDHQCDTGDPWPALSEYTTGTWTQHPITISS